MKVKIALIQMEIVDGDKEKNLKKALETLNSLRNSEKIPDIVCLPELFTTGYDLRNVESHAENFIGETLKKIMDISKNHFIVIGTILEEENGNYYNTAFILGKNGELEGKYRKTHLFSQMLEKEYLTPGDKISTFTLKEMKDLKIGLAICYDLRFPEIFRDMALNGAQIIFIPSEFPAPKRKLWKTLMKARAIENQLFIIGINRVGKGKSDDFFGCSIITNGDYSEILGNTPETKIFTIDLDTLEPIRQKIPLLNDRRSDLY